MPSPIVIKPIRNDNAYFGFSKELIPGTPVAPSIFPRWQDGSTVTINMKTEEIWEGDASRRLSQIIKNMQDASVKLTIMPRMNEISFFESLAAGSNSDAIGPATPSSTLSAQANAGASTFTLTSASAFPAAGVMQVILSPGTPKAEVVTVTLPAVTNTLTLANSATLVNQHASGDAVVSLTAVNASFQAAALAGDTTIKLTNNLGLTGSSSVPVVLSPGTAQEEIVLLTAPGTGSASPYIFTVANGGKVKNAHPTADLVTSPVIHTITDQNDGDYVTIEVGLGSLFGDAGITLRIRSCKMSQIQRDAKSGGVLTYTMEFSGIACTVISSPATVTFEQHSIFLYVQGLWTLDGDQSGDALNIEKFSITQKNNTDITQTESLTPAAINFGNLSVEVSFDVVYINGSRIQSLYFGGPSGIADSQVVYLGSFSVTFTQPDTFQSVTYTIATIAYTKTSMPAPKKDGKHSTLGLTAAATSNQGNNAHLITTIVNNTQYRQN